MNSISLQKRVQRLEANFGLNQMSEAEVMQELIKLYILGEDCGKNCERDYPDLPKMHHFRDAEHALSIEPESMTYEEICEASAYFDYQSRRDPEFMALVAQVRASRNQ